MTQPPAFHAAAKPSPAAPVSIPAPPEPQARPVVTGPVVTWPVVTGPVATPPAASEPPAVYQKPKPALKPAAPAQRPVSARPVPPAVAKTSNVEVAKSEPVPGSPAPYRPISEPAASASESPARIIPQPVPAYQSAPAPPAPLVALQVILRQGIQIAVRLDQSLSSDHLSPGDTFQASLAEPLVVDGYIIAERGARASGRIVDSRQAGRMSGTADLQLALSTFQTADGQKISVSTEPWAKEGTSPKGANVAKIGGAAALGAIIGAIAGGGKGAAIGAGVGGAAGTGATAATRGKPVTIPTETVIRFRLANRVTVTERPL
jgi:hypothetical protein